MEESNFFLSAFARLGIMYDLRMSRSDLLLEESGRPDPPSLQGTLLPPSGQSILQSGRL